MTKTYIPLDPSKSDEELHDQIMAVRARGKGKGKLAKARDILHGRFAKHSGPGAHPGTGSDQSVHGRGGAGNIESQPNTPQAKKPFFAQDDPEDVKAHGDRILSEYEAFDQVKQFKEMNAYYSTLTAEDKDAMKRARLRRNAAQIKAEIAAEKAARAVLGDAELHWGKASDLVDRSDKDLARIWELYAQGETWADFPDEVAALQTEFARRGIDEFGNKVKAQADIYELNAADERKAVTAQSWTTYHEDQAIRTAATRRWQESLAVEAEVTPVFESIAAETGGKLEGFEFRMKTQASLRRKMAQDMVEFGFSAEEAAANIRDVNRYTMTFPADESFRTKLDSALSSLEAKGWSIYDHKNKNFYGQNDHYDGINIQLTNGSQYVELQFHTPESFAIKQESHTLLDQLRTTPADDPKRAELISNIAAKWEGDAHIPPGLEDWGTPSSAILKALIAKESVFYIYTLDGETPLGLFTCIDTFVLRYEPESGEWVESSFEIPDIQGLGGDSGFERISNEYALSLMGAGDDGDDEDDDPDDPDFTAPVEIAKSDEHRNLVFGWASVALKDGQYLEDHQGDLIDVNDLEEAAYDFNVTSRLTGDMHKSEPFGELVESMVITQDKIDSAGFPQDMLGRWWVGFRVPPEYHKEVREGKRRMFSIEGTAKRVPT